MDLDIEKMQADYEKFKALTGKTGKRAKQLNALIDKLGERLVMAPSLSLIHISEPTRPY